jgi:hypothetical protein
LTSFLKKRKPEHHGLSAIHGIKRCALGGPRSDKHNDDRQRTYLLAQGRSNAGISPVAGIIVGSREQNVDVVPRA